MLLKEIPEAMKPRGIAIDEASTADKFHQLEAKAAQSILLEVQRVARPAMEEIMRQTTALDEQSFDVTAARGTIFDHLRDVLQRPSLSVLEKRAILALGTSDVSAVPS